MVNCAYCYGYYTRCYGKLRLLLWLLHFFAMVITAIAMVITHVAMVLQVGADPDPALSGRAGADAVHPGTTRGPW